MLAPVHILIDPQHLSNKLNLGYTSTLICRWRKTRLTHNALFLRYCMISVGAGMTKSRNEYGNVNFAVSIVLIFKALLFAQMLICYCI